MVECADRSGFRGGVAEVQEAKMTGVDVTLERLKPVAVALHREDATPAGLYVVGLEVG